MNNARRLVLLILSLLALTAAPSLALAADSTQAVNPAFVRSLLRTCDVIYTPGAAFCHGLIRSDIQPTAASPAATPAGYGPSQLQDAYNLGQFADKYALLPWPARPAIAIVDAFNHPDAEGDLAVYRSQFGLPECTTANGCFTKLNQNGNQLFYPLNNPGWASEIALDIEMASAICPTCRIILVEAWTNLFRDLGAAVNTAAAQPGVVAISNSYGAFEWSGEVSRESFYSHPGIAVTASSGDSGYGTQFPAASRYVVAVGGTSLTPDLSARGWHEDAWSWGGSGCSRFIPRPSYQNPTLACQNRSIADVSAVSDPMTGVAVYDSFPVHGRSGWLVFGGTSVASPIIASIYALANNTTSVTAADLYEADLYDVTQGRNGFCFTYLCIARPGYDGPTGNGTPQGLSGF